MCAQVVSVPTDDNVQSSAATPENRLTQRQLLFWLGQKRHSAVPLYNMVVEFEIGGALDVTKFQAAFSELVASCDALRSVFIEVDGIARRVVSAAEPFLLPFEDLSGLPDPKARYRADADRRSAQIFDLSRRCFDSKLFKLADGKFVWWFCQHHLIGDGASVGLMYRFFSEAYAGGELGVLGSGGQTHVQELAYQRSPRVSEDESFWTPRRKRQSKRVHFYSHPKLEQARHVERMAFELDRATSDRVREIGKKNGVSALPNLGVACFFETVLLAYLYRVTGRSEQALGIPFKNRHSRASRSAVGCFIEVSPVQVEVQPTDSFSSLFTRVQEETVAVLRHGQLCISNSEAHPLFDVTFNFLTERYPPFAGLPTSVTFSTGLHATGPLSATPISYWPGGESLNVHCQDYSGDGRFTLWFDFHALYFDTDQRARALEHWRNLFEAALSDLSRPIQSAEMVGARERKLLLDQFNPARVEPDVHQDVVSLFEARVRQGPERPAVHFREQVLSYGDLDSQAQSIAKELKRLGVGPGVLVGVLLDRSPRVPIALLAILKAGGAYVPLDPSHPPSRNALVMADAAPSVLLTERALLDSGAAFPSCTLVCVDEVPERPRAESTFQPVLRDQLAYVLFTSGSSGRPKGVAISHAALSNFLISMGREPGLEPNDRVLAITTIAFDIAALELFLPLVTGASIELIDGATAADPMRLAALIRERKPTVIQATPSTWQLLLEIGWQGDPKLKALCGGEALSPELATRLTSRVGELWNMYGPTETTVWSSLAKVDSESPLPVTIGSPIQNTFIYVLNEAQKLAPIGVAGEICIGGDGVAQGYHKNPELTCARFVEDPYASRPGGRMYHTGDLGVWRSDGRLECLGRIDFQVKIRGFRIELGEIESVLLGYSGVAAAVVVLREDRPGDKHLAAYVVARSDAQLHVGELRAFVQERLPGYMVPSAFTMLVALPRTPNGKIDRNALPKPEMASAQREPLTCDMEIRVASVFEKLLGVSSVGRQDSFFELGGHSLLAAQLLVQLNGIAKCPLSIGQIFQRPTVKELSQLILQGGTSDDDAIVIALNRASGGVPLFCICGIHLYSEFAQAIGSDHPVYGVYLPAEEKGVAAARFQGKDVSVEELAAGYLQGVRKQQPKGPYCLAGVSFGGVLAYEMAQQLVNQGEEVALLALFDSSLPRAKRRRWARWVSAHLMAAAKKGSLEYVLRRVRRVLGQYRSRSTLPAAEALPTEMQFRVGVYLAASRTYDNVVEPYPGSVLLFRADARDDFEGYELDRLLGWGDLARHIEVYDAPGSHLGILLEPGVRVLADPIRASLDVLSREANSRSLSLENEATS